MTSSPLRLLPHTFRIRFRRTLRTDHIFVASGIRQSVRLRLYRSEGERCFGQSNGFTALSLSENKATRSGANYHDLRGEIPLSLFHVRLRCLYSLSYVYSTGYLRNQRQTQKNSPLPHITNNHQTVPALHAPSAPHAQTPPSHRNGSRSLTHAAARVPYRPTSSRHPHPPPRKTSPCRPALS